MILIADSGSTKIDWRLLLTNGNEVKISTEGINPVFQTQEKIEEILRLQLLPDIEDIVPSIYVRRVFFYSAGVVSPQIRSMLAGCFASIFPNCSCEIESDLLAAARSLCGHQSGIACILGTGSNSCFFDGYNVVKNVRAGGYVLGDEGGGAYLGKMLLSDFIKGLLPKEIEDAFIAATGLDYPQIVQKIYHERVPSRFLASFAPFIFTWKEHPHIKKMVEDSFDEFICRNVKQYDYLSYPINFTGSIADCYQALLCARVEANGMEVGRIEKSPIAGLVKYHKDE